MTSGVLGLWLQSDVVGKTAALVLLAMSLACWTIIVTRAWALWHARRETALALNAFQSAANIVDCAARMRTVATANAFTRLTGEAVAALDLISGQASAQESPSAASRDTRRDGEHPVSEILARSIRRVTAYSAGRRESGLAILASVGATAPFVGLFGTVWGIYHALLGISLSGQASIDKVAGPVGEALIMTAFGIAVAVPAVLAYNLFNRANRVAAAELDNFAQDLHIWMVDGVKFPPAACGTATGRRG